MTDHWSKVWNILYRLYLPNITTEVVTCSQWYSSFQNVPYAGGGVCGKYVAQHISTGAQHREGR